MPVFALTVEGIERDDRGVRVRPGVPQEAFRERPLLKTIIQGCAFELRRPDGTTKRTRLVTYGIEAQRGPDGRLLLGGPPAEQPFLVTLDAGLTDADIPRGTQLWYVPEEEHVLR